MAKAILSNLRQALINRGFLVSLIGVVLVIFLSSVQDMLIAFRSEELLANGFHDMLITSALKADGMTLALPILAALPFTTCFVDDMKSGYVKEYLPRTTRKRYLWGKSIACAVSGGLVLAVGILAAYIISALLFSPMEAALAKGTEAPAYFGELMGKVLLFFCSGAFWSIIGLAFATLTNSKYMAYASPFVIYYVLIILYERYFNKLYVLYPKEWTNPSDAWMWGNLGVLLLMLELTIIFGMLFAAAAKRRLDQI